MSSITTDEARRYLKAVADTIAGKEPDGLSSALTIADDALTRNKLMSVIWHELIGMGECPVCGKLVTRCFGLKSQYCCRCGQHIVFKEVQDGD